MAHKFIMKYQKELSDDDGNTFDELYGALCVTTVVIGGSTYALVASLYEGGLQIVDISTPASPSVAASIRSVSP